MITTEELINLLINDNQTELNKLFQNDKWEIDINFRELYQAIIHNNNSSCQNMIGYMYLNGYEVDRNYEKSFYLYQLSADQGNSIAQYSLGYIYRNGQGVDQDHEKALYWYQLSVDQGNSIGQYHLGFMYKFGFGVNQDYEKALNLFQLSADQGYSAPQNYLGYMYEEGQGVEQDYIKAFYWYQLSADQGLVLAQKNIKKLLSKWLENGLVKYIQKIESKNQKLEEEIVHLKYRPGGIGFEECKDRFDKQDY